MSVLYSEFVGFFGGKGIQVDIPSRYLTGTEGPPSSLEALSEFFFFFFFLI